MAFPTFTPPVRQSPGTKFAPEIKTREADFGDGYTQSAPDGLNHIREVVTLQWSVLTPDQAKEIYDWLKARGGYQPFKYDVDEGEVKNWTCKEFTRSRETPYTVTATFREYFGVET